MPRWPRLIACAPATLARLAIGAPFPRFHPAQHPPHRQQPQPRDARGDVEHQLYDFGPLPDPARQTGDGDAPQHDHRYYRLHADRFLPAWAGGRVHRAIHPCSVTTAWRRMSHGSVGMLAIVAMIVLWCVAIASLSRWVGLWPEVVQLMFYVAAGVAWLWLLPLQRMLSWMETGKWRADRETR